MYVQSRQFEMMNKTPLMQGKCSISRSNFQHFTYVFKFSFSSSIVQKIVQRANRYFSFWDRSTNLYEQIGHLRVFPESKIGIFFLFFSLSTISRDPCTHILYSFSVFVLGSVLLASLIFASEVNKQDCSFDTNTQKLFQ